MHQPKYVLAKRKSLSDVLRSVGAQARRASANVEISTGQGTHTLICPVLSFALLG